MKRRDFLFTLPAIASVRGVPDAHAVSAPVWSNTASFGVQQGQSYSLNLLCSDPQGLAVVFSALSTLPFGVVLNQSSGVISVSSQTAAGTYGARFRAFNGLVASDSPFLNMVVTAVPVVNEPPPPQPPPLANSALVITPSLNFKKDFNVWGGVFWNKYQVDKREGIIGWCDGDHGDDNPYSNSVRYFNTGNAPFHGIP